MQVIVFLIWLVIQKKIIEVDPNPQLYRTFGKVKQFILG